MANELPTNVYGQQADPLLPNAFDFPGESQSQDLFQQILKTQESQQTFDPLNVKESFNEVKDRFFSAGKLDFIDEDDPALFTAYKRSMDYLMDMGLAGLGTADTAIKLAVTAVAQPLRLISDENAERFSRDTMGLIEYAGSRIGGRNLTEIDDALESGIKGLNRAYQIANQKDSMPTTFSFSGNLLPTYRDRDTLFYEYPDKGSAPEGNPTILSASKTEFRDPFNEALSTIDIPQKGILGEDLLRQLKKMPEMTPELIPESIELNKKYTLNDLFDLSKRKFEGLYANERFRGTQRQSGFYGQDITLSMGDDQAVLGGELGYFETKINFIPEKDKEFSRVDTAGVYDTNTIAHVRGSLYQHYVRDQESLKDTFFQKFFASPNNPLPDTSRFDSIIFPFHRHNRGDTGPGKGMYILAEEIQSKMLNPNYGGIKTPFKDAKGNVVRSEDELFNNMFNIPVLEDAGVFKVDDLNKDFSSVKTTLFDGDLRNKGFYTDAMVMPTAPPGFLLKNVTVPDNFNSEVKTLIKGTLDFQKEIEKLSDVRSRYTFFNSQTMNEQKRDILNLVKKYAPKNDPDLKGFIDVDNGLSLERILDQAIIAGETNLFNTRQAYADQRPTPLYKYLTERLTDEYVRNTITDIPEFSYLKSLDKIEDSEVMDTVDLPEFVDDDGFAIEDFVDDIDLTTDEFDDFLETYVDQGKKPSVAFAEEYGRDMLGVVYQQMLSEFLSSTFKADRLDLNQLEDRLFDLDERYEKLMKDKFGSVEVAEQMDINYREKRNNLKDIFNFYRSSYKHNYSRYSEGKKYVSSPISNNQDISDQALKVLIQKAEASGAKFIVLPSVSGQILSRSTRDSDALAEGIKKLKLSIKQNQEQLNAPEYSDETANAAALREMSHYRYLKQLNKDYKEKLSELEGSQFYRLYTQAVNNSVADLERNYPVTVHRDVPLPYRTDTANRQVANPENLNGTVIDVERLIEDFDVESPRFGGTIMTAASDAQELGFTKPVFHYTMAKGGQFEDDMINPEFNVKTNEFGYAYRGDPFDQLGVHVGTLKAAQDRGMSQMQQLLEGYGYYGTPDFNDKDEVAALGRFMVQKKTEGIDIELGSVVPLMADLSKPLQGEALGLGYTDIRTVLDRDGKPRLNKAGEEITQKKFVPASENQVRDFINKKIEEFKEKNLDSAYSPDVDKTSIAFRDTYAEEKSKDLTQREIVELIAEDLGKQGYTHIPYTNEIEDVNSTSMIMLTNRPDKKAVLRSKFAKFSPRDQMSEELGKYQGGLI